MDRDEVLRNIFEAVEADVKRRAEPESGTSSNFYMQREVLPAGHVVQAQHQHIRLERDTVMVFQDKAPLFNWGHPCVYHLYDAERLQPYDSVPAEFPPYLVNPPETFQVFHQPVTFPETGVTWTIPRWPFPWPPHPRRQNWYAILFSGASNNRHTNDLEFLYRTLRHLYHVPADHIYVLNYDGTLNYSGGPKPVATWPGDGTPYQMPVNGAGTKKAFEDAIDELKKRLDEDDYLLIHTNNHGGLDEQRNEAYLCTYSGPSYYQSDFAAKVGELPRFSCLMTMMEQCHSGGFNAPLMASSPSKCASIASACLKANNSIGGPDFDPFARDWIAAVSVAQPNGSGLPFSPDTNNNGRIEAEEAFGYANAVHDPYDTPVYNETSEAGGDCNLGVYRWIWPWPLIEEIVEEVFHRPIPDPGPLIERLEPELERIQGEMVPRFDDLQETLRALLRKAVEEAAREGGVARPGVR